MNNESDREKEKSEQNKKYFRNREKYFRESRLQASKELFKKIEYILFGYAISLFSYARFHEESCSIVKTHPKAFVITAFFIILSLGLLIFLMHTCSGPLTVCLKKKKRTHFQIMSMQGVHNFQIGYLRALLFLHLSPPISSLICHHSIFLTGL